MLFTDSRGNQIEKPGDAPAPWRIAAYVVIEVGGKVLMVQSGGGLWVFPGGGVEEGEGIVDAAVRECAEETGYRVTITDGQPLFVREQPFYHAGQQRFYRSLQLFYRATLAEATPDLGLIDAHDKSRRSDWVAAREIPVEAIHHTVRELIAGLGSD